MSDARLRYLGARPLDLRPIDIPPSTGLPQIRRRATRHRRWMHTRRVVVAAAVMALAYSAASFASTPQPTQMRALPDPACGLYRDPAAYSSVGGLINGFVEVGYFYETEAPRTRADLYPIWDDRCVRVGYTSVGTMSPIPVDELDAPGVDEEAVIAAHSRSNSQPFTMITSD